MGAADCPSRAHPYGFTAGRWDRAAGRSTGGKSAFHRTDAYHTMADVLRQQRLIHGDH